MKNVYKYSLYHVANTLRRHCKDLDSTPIFPHNRLRNCIIASASSIPLNPPTIATRRCGGRSRQIMLGEALAIIQLRRRSRGHRRVLSNFSQCLRNIIICICPEKEVRREGGPPQKEVRSPKVEKLSIWTFGNLKVKSVGFYDI